MVTTLNLRDSLGRPLTNATPGTSDATDQLGRDVVTGDVDFIGRDLIALPWAATTAVALGDYMEGTGGELAVCVIAGTTAASEPTWPAYGATVVDATVTWERVS
jgi:hypothetical protein